MAFSRRDFLKVGAAAGAAALFGWSVDRGNRKTIKGAQVPGSGEVGHFSAEQLEAIEVDAFLAACARCGVCIAECPFSAIKSDGWQMPLLTDTTRIKCPGFDICGVCLAVCPTSALSEAFAPLEDRWGLESGVTKEAWWKGKEINKDLITKPEVDAGGD